MRKPLLAALLITALTVSPSLANETQGNHHAGRNFEKQKQNKLKRLDKLRQCIAASQNLEEMRSCKSSNDPKAPNKP
jgi:hypothetical protein